MRGLIRPVGGIPAKIEAASEAGVKKVLIPQFNWQGSFKSCINPEVVPVGSIEEVFEEVFLKEKPVAALPSH